MDIEVLEMDDRRTRFLVRDITSSFANGIRRSIIGDVPTLTIDQVDFYENNSVLFDEVLALRLGLVPLSADIDEFVHQDECSCEGEGCTSCEVSLTLDVSAGEESRMVRSSDLESEDPEVEVADDNIAVIELKPGQSVIAECVARLGLGSEHAKNQGGVAVGYKHLKRAVENGGYDEEILRGFVEDMDGDLVDMSEHGNEFAEVFDGDVGVEDVEDSYVFHVESDGSMQVDDLVAKASESLQSKSEELKMKIKGE